MEGSICPKCGKEFFPYPEHVYKYGKQRWCSWTCFNHRNDGKNRAGKGWSGKVVQQYTLDGELIREFKSVNKAADYMGCCANTIRKACVGETKMARKFIWKYKSDEPNEPL